MASQAFYVTLVVKEAIIYSTGIPRGRASNWDFEDAQMITLFRPEIKTLAIKRKYRVLYSFYKRYSTIPKLLRSENTMELV